MMITQKQLFITEFNLNLAIAQSLICVFILGSRTSLQSPLGHLLICLWNFKINILDFMMIIEIQMRK